MIIPEIKYQLHDSLIESAEMIDANQMKLSIKLYSIYYPDDKLVQLSFCGIINTQKAAEFCTTMNNDPCNDDPSGDGSLGYRINSFHYDEKKMSSSNNLYLFFDVEYIKPLKLHCTNFTFEELF